MSAQRFREARRMLSARSAQLRRNHFDDDPHSTCDECRLAYQVRRELEALRAIDRARRDADLARELER